MDYSASMLVPRTSARPNNPGPLAVNILLDLNQSPTNGTVLNVTGSGANDLSLNTRGTSDNGYDTSPIPLTTLTVSAEVFPLWNPVSIGGTPYAGSTTQGLAMDLTTANQRIVYKLLSKERVSVGFFWKTDMDTSGITFHNYDFSTIKTSSGNDGYLSYKDYNTNVLFNQCIENEVNRGRQLNNNVQSLPGIPRAGPVSANTWYWITHRFSVRNGIDWHESAVYNATTKALITNGCTGQPSNPAYPINELRLGSTNSGNNAGKHMYFANYIADWTNAVFPLLP